MSFNKQKERKVSRVSKISKTSKKKEKILLDSNEVKKLLLNSKEVKKLLGIGRNSLLILLNSPDFPSFKIGARWYVKSEELDHWIKRQENNI